MQKHIRKILAFIISFSMILSNSLVTVLADNEDDLVVKIDRLTVSVRDGGKDVNGKYTWITDGKEDSKDHRFTFRINYAISGTYDYEPEKVEIRIPKQILRNRDGNFADYYDMSVPEYNDPDIDETVDFVFKEDGDNIVIYNIIPVPGGTNGFIEVSYLTTERTWEYKDVNYQTGSGASDDFYATMHIEQGEHADPENPDSVDTYLEANKESNKIPVYIDTTAKITNIDKQVPKKLYRSWQSSWGTEVQPANSDDYFYLVWPIRTWITANQPYNFDLTDVFTATNGRVIGYSTSNTNFKATYPTQTLKTDYTNYSRYDYVLTAHPKVTYNQNEWQVKNSVRGHVDPYDQVDTDTYANDNAIFKYKAPVWSEPTGHFMLSKKGYKYRGESDYDDVNRYHYDSYGWGGCASESIRSYKLDQFKDGSIDSIDNLKYRVLQIGYAYPWTRNSTLQDPSAFGHNPVKYVVADNELFLGKLGNNDNDISLDWQDANIYQLDFNISLYDAYFDEDELKFYQGAKVTEYKDSEFIDFFIEVKNSGEYIKIVRYNPSTGEYSQINNTYIKSAEGQTIKFNTDFVTGFKLEHSNARYHTAINAYPYVKLHNTSKVMNFIGEEIKVYVKDWADSKVYDYQGNEIVEFKDKEGYDYIMSIIPDGHITKKVKNTRNNKVKKNYVITWESSAYESYHDEEATFKATEQVSGTFYDLLPLGGEYVDESVKVTGYKNGTLSEYNGTYQGGESFAVEDFTVSIKENYKKSGRDLLTIKINEPAEYYTIQLDTVHIWNNIKDYGKDVLNNIAYETGNDKIGDGLVDGSNDIFGTLDQTAGNAKKFLYESATHHISLITNALLNLKKQVRASQDEHYSYKTKTYPDSDYYYNIRFATDEETTARDLMVMDSLENYITASGATSAWRGYLKGINVKEIENLGAAPKIYYSSVENLDLEKYKDRSIYPTTDSVLADTIGGNPVWVAEENFANIAEAKAFLVDIRKKDNGQPFVLDYDTGVQLTVAMHSPTEVGSLEHYNAYNNIYLWDTIHSKDGDVLENNLVHQDFTQITYVVTADIPIHKVSAKDNSVAIRGTKWELKGDSIYGNTMDQEGTTDANGNYTFKKIEAGTYKLRETYVNNDYFINPNEYTVVINMDGTVSIEGVDQDNNRFVLENEVRVHTDIEFYKVGLFAQDAEPEPENVGNARYAVSVYGIQADIDDQGNTTGLTFGPALGTSYVNSYKSHEPTGTTSNGNAHRCIHNDTWAEIIEWNNKDPYVYEQCITEGCTHSVYLDMSKTALNQSYTFTGSGDGPSVLVNTLDTNERVWNNYNDGNGYNSGGWGASNIRAYLNGADDDTTASGTYAVQNNITADNALINAFPSVLQNAIVPRATKYDSVYNQKTEANLKTTYDKLWLLSPNEIWTTSQNTNSYYAHPLEGNQYPYFAAKSLTTSTNSQTGTVGYNENSSANYWWLRSSCSNSSYIVCNVFDNGNVFSNIADSNYGVAPCFSLSSNAPERSKEIGRVRIADTTFKLTGTSDYGTEYNVYATSQSRGIVRVPDIEKGTYELIETKPNEDYINPSIKYTVVIDENGNVSITGEDFIYEENGNIILENESWHNFSIRKKDSTNGSYLSGAMFKLTGTDNYGNEVDMIETTNNLGSVLFDPLASGTYILQEVKTPKNYAPNPHKYIVEIDRLGIVTIDGLSQEEDGMFVFPNDRGQDGKIKITKIWNDGLTGEDAANREIPEIKISTIEPAPITSITATLSWVGDTQASRPSTVVAKLYKGNTLLATSETWVDNRNNTWTYDFPITPEGSYKIKLENVDGYDSNEYEFKEFKGNKVALTLTKKKVSAKYAVSVYGIEVDKGETNNTLGITFGPALGANYVQTYKSHTPSGTTSSGNAHRCIHNDNWDTIIHWNDTDPYVYEQCIAEGCTHSVELDQDATTTIMNKDRDHSTITGDGPSILCYELVNTENVWENLRWHPNDSTGSTNYGTNSGGWGASRIRAMLNGADSLIDIGTNKYSSYASSDTNKSASIYTSGNTLLDAFPSELQTAIAKKAVKYDSVYNQKTEANLKTTYDKLWLLSPNEMNLDNSASSYYQHPLEGTAYQYFNGKALKSGYSTNADYQGYYSAGDFTTSGSGSTNYWWLRSSSSINSNYVCYLNDYGNVNNNTAYNNCGVAPCFTLR